MKAVEVRNIKIGEGIPKICVPIVGVTKEDIINEAKKQVKDILDPAKKEISDAENERMEAIKEFNEKYGVYTETFSGDKAVEQYNRVLNQFNSTFENFWKPFYNWLF